MKHFDTIFPGRMTDGRMYIYNDKGKSICPPSQAKQININISDIVGKLVIPRQHSFKMRFENWLRPIYIK